MFPGRANGYILLLKNKDDQILSIFESPGIIPGTRCVHDSWSGGLGYRILTFDFFRDPGPGGTP